MLICHAFNLFRYIMSVWTHAWYILLCTKYLQITILLHQRYEVSILSTRGLAGSQLNPAWYALPLVTAAGHFIRTAAASGVRCCFWLNLSFDLSHHKSCLNWWLKPKIRRKSETALHPRCASCRLEWLSTRQFLYLCHEYNYSQYELY